MNTKVLCKWLELPNWPPDHYALLGLKPGDGDAAHLEQRVHERMARLRCYQISYPEEATEGMNRLAQAFICVSEALAKSPYVKCETSPKKPSDDTVTHLVGDSKTDVDWKSTPPPVRGAPGRAGMANGQANVPVARPAASTTSASEIAINQVAEDFSKARRGLGTLPALIERIYLTRKLVRCWSRVGKYLKQADRKLRPAEEADLMRRLNQIFELMGEFPAIIGHPGRPGYRVVAMARLEMTAQMFRMLDASQRTCLASDWQAGYRVLLSYRHLLRNEFKRLRGRTPTQLAMAAVRGALNDHPVWVSAGVVFVIAVSVFAYCMLL